MYTTGDFWIQTAERAVKTFCQTVLAVVGVELVAIDSIDWLSVVSVAATAAVLSVLTSVATSGIGDRNTPSAVKLGEPVVVSVPSQSFPPEAIVADALDELAAVKASHTPNPVPVPVPVAVEDAFIVRGDN